MKASARQRAFREVGTVLLAAALLAGSSLLPYWRIVLYAPQYPGGLQALVYLTHVAGDAQEITTLNHYIGMKPLEEAAPVERAVAMPVVLLFGALAVLSGTRTGPWRWLLRLPLVLFPLGFTADLAAWLWHYGHSMDPAAPIRLEPFMPVLLGTGKIAQFTTIAQFHVGFYVALLASLLALLDLRRGPQTEVVRPKAAGRPVEVPAR